MARAAEEFDRLADALLAANARGQKVLAMAGCCRGEGATTLLLCAARRLAERGVKLVLVDADLSRPRLAKRLGVELQSGWNEAIRRGRDVSRQCGRRGGRQQPGPLGDPRAGVGRRPNARRLVAAGPVPRYPEKPLRNGARRSGAAGKHRIDRRLLGRTVGGKIDAVLLVRNPRITSEARLADVESQLTASAVALAGLIENFVA